MKSVKDYSLRIVRRGFWAFTASFVLAAFLILSGTGECQTPTPSGSNLVGTIISKMFTGAVIKDAKGEQSFYRIHDKLPDGSQIIKVADDHISLKAADGSLFTMFILHEKTESRVAGPTSAPASPPVASGPYRSTAPSATVSPPAASGPYRSTTPQNPRQSRVGRRSSSEPDD